MSAANEAAGALFSYKLKADSGYQAGGQGRITPEQYGRIMAIMHGTDSRPALIAALQEAVSALAGGLWDYGPGQDEHTKCNEILERCRTVLAGAQL